MHINFPYLAKIKKKYVCVCLAQPQRKGSRRALFEWSASGSKAALAEAFASLAANRLAARIVFNISHRVCFDIQLTLCISPEVISIMHSSDEGS